MSRMLILILPTKAQHKLSMKNLEKEKAKLLRGAEFLE